MSVDKNDANRACSEQPGAAEPLTREVEKYSVKARVISWVTTLNLMLTLLVITYYLLGQRSRVESWDEVLTKRLVVASDSGSKRAVFGITNDGTFEFSVGDATGEPDWLLKASSEKTEVLIGGPRSPRILLRSGADGSEIVLLGSAQQACARLTAGAHATSLVFLGEDQRMRSALVASNGETQLTMLDSDGVPRIGLGMSQSGPAVVLQDDRNIPRIAVAVANGTSRMIFRDRDGVTRTEIAETDDEISLRTNNDLGPPATHVNDMSTSSSNESELPSGAQ